MELKLVLYLLDQDKVGSKITVGASKDTRFAWESWYQGINASLSDMIFHLEPAHCKLYPRWRRSETEEGDRHVVKKIWAHVDAMIEEIARSERRDFVPSLMASPPPTQVSQKAVEILREMRIDVYNPSLTQLSLALGPAEFEFPRGFDSRLPSEVAAAPRDEHLSMKTSKWRRDKSLGTERKRKRRHGIELRHFVSQ